MTSTPSLPAQIKTLLRITARLEAGGVVVVYPEELPSLNAVLVTLQQHERDDTRINQLDDECQRFMREVALLREGHERLEALVKAAREWVHCDCPRATPRLPTEQAIVDALAALDTAFTKIELELARRDTKENVAKF